MADLDLRRLRIRELALVLGIGFLSPALYSLQEWLTGPHRYAWTEFDFLVRLLETGLVIALLAYVLFRQGRDLGAIGLTFRRSDVLWALPIAFCSNLLVNGIAALLVTYGIHDLKAPPSAPLGLVGWLAILPSAAKEELIVRAYLMTEVSELTGNMALAVLASVGFQAFYHLYQGTPAALLHVGAFFVSAAFYASTRRITPVIYAHALHNFWAYYNLS